MIWRALAIGFAIATHEAQIDSARAQATADAREMSARAACAVDTSAAQRCNDQLIECDAWRDSVQHNLQTILNLLRGDF